MAVCTDRRDFNPHEREARDPLHVPRGQRACHFNPHEREARDLIGGIPRAPPRGILIHTSVKLVTGIDV